MRKIPITNVKTFIEMLYNDNVIIYSNAFGLNKERKKYNLRLLTIYDVERAIKLGIFSYSHKEKVFNIEQVETEM